MVNLNQHGNNALFNRTLKAARFLHSRIGRAGTARLQSASEWLVANNPNVGIKNSKFHLPGLHSASESSSLCVQLWQLTALSARCPQQCLLPFPVCSLHSPRGRFAGLTMRINFLLLSCHWSLCCVQTQVTTPTGGRGGGFDVKNPIEVSILERVIQFRKWPVHTPTC